MNGKAVIVTRTGARVGKFEPQRQRDVCEAAAMSKGHHPRTVRTVELQSGAPLFPENASVVSGLGAGDALFVPALSTLADNASVRIAAIRSLVGKGVAVSVIELGGDVGPVLSILETAFADALALEREMERREELHHEEVAELQASNAAFEKSLVATIVARYGLPAAGLDGLAGLRAETETKLAAATAEMRETTKSDGEKAREQDATVGAWLTATRKQRGLTLTTLGDMLGVSAPTLSRLEASGTGPQLMNVVAFLASEVEPTVDAIRKAAAEWHRQQEAATETETAEAAPVAAEAA